LLAYYFNILAENHLDDFLISLNRLTND